ncbi:MAG: hypothetical protein KAX15_04230 [Candidatus Omnitrophica bacterium]|nr:hypothetical protein [Candidatus Omnitrophota bacterium]
MFLLKRRKKMGLTHFPSGVSSFGIPLYGSGFGPPLGLGTGNVKYVVKAKASTNLYYQKLQSNGIKDSDIFITVAAAFGAAVAGQNDVVAVTPGAYDETASLGWNKANTHLIGLGGPNSLGDWSEPNVCIYTDSTSVAEVINITGQNCMFLNVNIENYGNHASNIAAVKLDKYGCYFEGCRIAGNMTANQNGAAAAGSLLIAAGGMYPVFRNCQFGQDVWGTRTTANSGVIVYNNSGRPNGSDFINCRIVSVGDDVECAMVRIATSTSIGRGHRFDNCIFSHFASTGAGDKDLTRAFYSPSTGVQKDIIHLHSCMGVGITEWQDDDDDVVWADMPVTGLGGGLGRNPTAPVGT